MQPAQRDQRLNTLRCALDIDRESLCVVITRHTFSREEGTEEVEISLFQRRRILFTFRATIEGVQRLEHIRCVERVDPFPLLIDAVVPTALRRLMGNSECDSPLCD